MKKIIFSLFILNFLISTSAQVSHLESGLRSITPDVLKGQLGFLASDWTEGRETGEKGEFLASDYIASVLQLAGVKPGGDYPQGLFSAQNRPERSYFQNFVLLKTEPGSDQILKLKLIDNESIKTKNYTYGVDFQIRASGNGFEIEAPIVFAGYAYKNDNLKFNDFNKLDVKGKFILKIAGVPGFVRERLTPAQIRAYSDELEKMAKSMGAAGIIEFNPNVIVVGNAQEKDFNNMAPSESNPRSSRTNVMYSVPGKSNSESLVRITISGKVANEIIGGSGYSIDDYIKKADENLQYTLPSTTGKSMYIKSEIITTPVAVRNVIGIIEGKYPDQVIVLGAHYDHMGMNKGYIWNGADDNASGTVGVMTLARAIMETGVKPEKTIIIALWTAEEVGLLGSRYYVENLTYPLANLKLNVNFDMISRYIADNEPDKVLMTYSTTFPVFREITEKNLKTHGIKINMEYQPSPNPPGGSDHQSFVAAGVPVMRFKPGHREEYHTPSDDISTVNWDIMEKIIQISFADIWELANSKW
jgi:hypothetical protein